MKTISFVIPCYHSEKSIAGVCSRIIKTVKTDGRYDYEIICVNDGSSDGTWDVLCRLSEENNKLKSINLSRNFGQHSALMAGFNYVKGDIVVCLDDDGQNPPEEMFKLVDKLEEGYDVVSAKYKKKRHSAFRNVGAWLSDVMSTHLIDKPRNVDLNSYYATRRYVIDEVIKYKNSYPFVHGLILRITRNMTDVYVTHEKREHGKSGYSMKKLIGLWMNGFTAFSEKPLRFASITGIILSALGFLFGIVIVVRKLLHPEIALGYSSIMATILFLAGIILLFLGLLGEYIGRIYICINNAPQYAIRETNNIDESDRES